MAVAIQLITSDEALKNICQQASDAQVIAIDTEFKRETTYFPKACLIQIATDNLIACVDPFQINDFEPLKALLYNPDILKIFHAARQDLEIFYFLFNEIPKPIYDTQIAATLLGFPEQTGYATLAKNVLNIELDKSLTRADWEIRPIPEKQIEYAANDVIYLLKIYHSQIQQLEKSNRLNWLEHDFDYLLNIELYEPAPDSAWKKIKNYNRLNKAQRCIAYKISQWREITAIKRNRPRTFIIKNQSILDLAHQQPGTKKELQSIRDIHPNLIKRDGEILLELIELAKTLSDEECPEVKKTKILSNSQSLLLNSLQTIIQLNARKHKIDSSYLCTKKDLEKVILQDEDAILLHGWRYELAGKDVVKFIKGETKLEVINGVVMLTANEGSIT